MIIIIIIIMKCLPLIFTASWHYDGQGVTKKNEKLARIIMPCEHISIMSILILS